MLPPLLHQAEWAVVPIPKACNKAGFISTCLKRARNLSTSDGIWFYLRIQAREEREMVSVFSRC